METDATVFTADSMEWQSPKQAKRWGYRNIYGISISVGAVYTAYLGLASLQSSINPGIGLAALSVMYVSSLAGATLSPCMLKLFGAKFCALAGSIGVLLYILANLYPSWFTLVPSAVIAGFTSRSMWAGLQSHSKETATAVALALNKKPDYLIGKFLGIIMAGYTSSYILGNLVSSLILFPYNGVNRENLTSSGFDYSGSYNETGEDSHSMCDVDGSDIDQKLSLILTSVYAVLVVAGIVILLVFMDRFPTENSFFSTEKKLYEYLGKPLTDIFSLLKSVKMCLMAPMMFLLGLEVSFAFGTFTEVYISSCFGTYQVGFTLAALGVSSVVTCMVYGKLLKYIPRLVITQFGVFLAILQSVFLLVWERTPSYTVIFTFSIGWGMIEAILSTSACVAGILFPNKSQTAYSVNLLWTGLALSVGYAMGELVPLKGQLSVILATAVLTFVCVFIVEVVYLRHSSLPCCTKVPDPSKHNGEQSATNPVENGVIGEIKDGPKPTVNGSHTSVYIANNPSTPAQGPAAHNPLFVLHCEFKTAMLTPVAVPSPSNKELSTIPHTAESSQIPCTSTFPNSVSMSQFAEVNVNNSVVRSGDSLQSNLLKSIKYSQSYMNALQDSILPL